MAQDNKFVYKDISVISDNVLLVVENGCFRREFDLSAGVPRTLGLWDKKTGKQLAGETPDTDFSFIGLNMPGGDRTLDYQIEELLAVEKPASLFDGERVEIEMHIKEHVQQLEFRRIYIVYPDLPVIAVSTSIRGKTVPNVYWSRRGEEFNNDRSEAWMESCADSIKLSDELQPELAVEFAGRTDYTNDIVMDHRAGEGMYNGNLLFCKESSGAGLFVLQEAPPSSERRDYEKHDYRITDGRIFSCGWGIEPQELDNNFLKSYRHVIGIFPNDGTGGTSVLKNYLRTRFPFDPNEKCSVMVNPWGCGCFRDLVSEPFLEEELRAAGKLNATHYQIDDGWQAGRTLQELENNNRCAGHDFWEINRELLPNGFEPVLKAAEEAGVEPALWVAPSANQHYRDWQEFAVLLYDYHQRYGFKIFKIDYVRTKNKEAEDNLEKMLRALREKSGGDIYFNLDTTNGQRPGYFMFLEYGNIFLENRYVCHNWGIGYHPEETLSNFWRLSQYVRAQSLQIEIPDPDIINYEFYEKRGTTPPDVYSCDYWAAIALFANPLLWFAPSRLKPAAAQTYTDMMSLHRRLCKDIFAGEIYPIGAEPTGKSITGFQSHNADTGNGLFILYCEKEAPLKSEVELKLLDSEKSYCFSQLDIDSESVLRETSGSMFSVEFEIRGSWKLFRYQLDK